MYSKKLKENRYTELNYKGYISYNLYNNKNDLNILEKFCTKHTNTDYYIISKNKRTKKTASSQTDAGKNFRLGRATAAGGFSQ